MKEELIFLFGGIALIVTGLFWNIPPSAANPPAVGLGIIAVGIAAILRRLPR